MSKRLVVCFCIFIILSFTLLLRIGTIATNQVYLSAGVSQSSYTLQFNKTRGQIYDRNFVSLTDNEKQYLAACLPVPENMAAIKNTAALKTSDSLDELMEKGHPFLLRSSLPKLNIPYVNILSIPKRYGASSLAQHVLGYLDVDGVGAAGLEKVLNNRLSAHAGTSTITYKVDAMRMPLVGEPPEVTYAPILPEGVVLTIDRKLQKIVEEVGRSMLPKGAIVIMEPDTGKIRAIASFPSYRLDYLSEEIADAENSPMLNRAYLPFSVGSTFKISTAAAALEMGIPVETTFYCGGEYNVGGQIIRCNNHTNHGWINMKQAMAASCNPYFIQLGLQVGRERLQTMGKDLSFSKESIFVEDYGSESGYLPTLEELFNPAAVANFSFGQGLLMGTPIQVAQMLCAVVNGGNTPQAQLIEGYSQDGTTLSETTEPGIPVKAFTPETAKTIQDFLMAFVMDPAKQNARPKYVTAGGKTATAQTGQFPDGREEELLQGWFAGYFPAENPEYVAVVLAEDAESGNVNASPVFAAIADRLYAPADVPSELVNR